MIVWLWDAPGAARCGRGISDDQGRARRAAEACLRSGQASDARVEEALAVLGTDAMASGYRRTGQGWQARRGARGAITWEPLTGGAR